MYDIVEHPVYAAMPCTVDDDGKIDWTIPSNRKPGSKNWDGNVRRRDWWRCKAAELNIPTEGKWLSRTAKAIHPFKEKPCQTCGRVMEVAYVYPTKYTVRRLNALLPANAQIDFAYFLKVEEFVLHMFEELGERRGAWALRRVFPNIEAAVKTAEDVALSVRKRYTANESRQLSPGAMANPPDRLDGFHTYNLCCRSGQDTGRAQANLATYGIDRRAYEQWCEGDWNVADYVMNRIANGPCTAPGCTEVGRLTADHVGPISLGFRHSPHFRALCRSCNSAKNNRMSLDDVSRLRALQATGDQVVSWQAEKLWATLSTEVRSDADALLLSKLLRINQHHYLDALSAALEARVPDVLLSLTHPEHALERVDLIGFDPVDLNFSRVVTRPRQDSYAAMRAARMLRVSFDSLSEYATKAKRNVQLVSDTSVKSELDRYRSALRTLYRCADSRRTILLDVMSSTGSASERDARLLHMDTSPAPKHATVLQALRALMDAYQVVLIERFRRGETVSWADLVAV